MNQTSQYNQLVHDKGKHPLENYYIPKYLEIAKTTEYFYQKQDNKKRNRKHLQNCFRIDILGVL